MKKKKPIARRNRAGLSPSKGHLTENKLTYHALNREYSFEWGFNFHRRILRITGEIEQGHFDFIDSALTELEAESKATITVRIHSTGGDCYEALAIVDRLRASRCYIVTEGYGAVMSAATLILACGDRRRAAKNCVFMHHESSYDIGGRHEHVKATVKQMEREEKQWAHSMARFSKRDYDFWFQSGKNIDAYYDSEELLDMGVVDEIFATGDEE